MHVKLWMWGYIHSLVHFYVLGCFRRKLYFLQLELIVQMIHFVSYNDCRYTAYDQCVEYAVIYPHVYDKNSSVLRLMKNH